MKDELKQILLEITAAVNEAWPNDDLKVSNDMILDCAVRMYNTRQIPGRESYQPQSSPPEDKPLAEPPTEKQAFFLNKHGLNPAHFNKKTAHAKISELMKK